MIILEGADCVGKTTVANALLKGYFDGWSYRHLSKLSDDFDGFWGHYNLLPAGGAPVIQDRFYLSEMVYSSVLHRSCKITPFELRLLEAKALLESCFTVVLIAPDKTIAERWAGSQSEQMFSLEQVLAVNKRFASCDYGVHVDLILDSSRASACDVAEIIAKRFEAQQQCLKELFARA